MARLLWCTTALVPFVGWSAPALAQGAAVDAIEEVVVTAQRREQQISDVPIAISVVSAATLEEVGAKSGASLQGLVPALNINATASYGGSPVSIRGTSGLGGAEDPVAVYIDDVYTSSGQFSVTALSDVSSVEVVRGPQGTLQGRNATAGALIIRTADPEREFGGYIRATLEDPTAHRIEAAATGPLGQTLAGRMSLDWLNEEGWATNLFDGRKMGGTRMHNVRATLLWEPVDAARVRLSVNYQDRIVSQPTVRWAQTTIYPAPGPVTPVGTQTPQIPLPAAEQDRYLDDKVVNLNIEPRNHLRSPSMVLNAQYDFGPMTLVSVTGASNYVNEGVNDSDSLAMTDRQGRNAAKYTGSAISQELRLQSNDSERLDWILGYYYARYQATMNFDIFNQSLSTPINQVSNFLSDQTNPNWAVFADATWRVTDQISLTGGVRYTEDTKDFGNTWTSINTDTGAVLGRVPFDAPKRTWTDTSYRAKAAWEPSDDVMAYLSYSKGFKAGGYNAFGVGVQPGYNPEIMKSWEVGVKAYLWERRAFVAAAAYDNLYDNLQVTSGVPTGGVVITNAASAKIKGFEVEGELRPTPNWTFLANLAYIDGKFSSFPRAPNILGVLTDASGNRLTNSPEWQYFLQGQYRAELSADWDVRVTANWRWRDEIYFNPTDQELAHLRGPANGELGARVSFIYRPMELTFAIYGNNLNDSRVVANQGLTFSYPQAFFNRPRVIGVQLEKKF
ncbi:TonB-dependent receptor [Phenylobacterium sp.]|uniref:TonB-dependent receptor n=1 Tax=Phenylobacterium sp. TaxID=1871053 RepID=UPI00289ED1B6|nr:TonB-dependent receptor [Phenylobacterium sp.]